jgi:hypothetical protein
LNNHTKAFEFHTKQDPLPLVHPQPGIPNHRAIEYLIVLSNVNGKMMLEFAETSTKVVGSLGRPMRDYIQKGFAHGQWQPVS